MLTGESGLDRRPMTLKFDEVRVDPAMTPPPPPIAPTDVATARIASDETPPNSSTSRASPDE